MKRIATTALALALVTGCGTVRDAREAQAELEEKGRDVAPAACGKVDLRRHSLEDLVAFAMTNRASMISARLAVEDARLNLRTIAADAPILSDTSWTAPKLSISGGYSESSPGTTFNGGVWRTEGGPSAAVSLDLLVYDFGRYGARAKEGAERVVAAELALVNAGYQVFSDVAVAYFDFFERRALLEVALTNELQYAEHLGQAQARYDAGEANQLDVLKARLDLSRARQTAVSVSNEVATSGAALMYALGVDASRGTSDEAFGTDSVGVDSVRRGFAMTTVGVDAAYAVALTNAPSVRATRARLRAASHAVDYAVADLMPTVSASLALNWSDPLWYWKWGLSGVQSLFQGFRKTTAVDRAVVAMRQAAADVEIAERELSVRLETAIAGRDNSRSALASAVASMKSARENLDIVREQLNVGGASRIDLSDAIAGHSQALGDTITAFYDGQRAEARLFAILGAYPVYREEIVKGKE